MKYVMQFGIISAICFVAEILHSLIPLPIPASVYGLALLFFMLMTGIVKLHQVENAADFLLVIMPVLFISPSVSLITSLEIVKGNLLALILMALGSTVLVILITGEIAQLVIKIRKREKKGENHE